MRISATNTVILALAVTHSAVGHTTFTNFFVNGVDQVRLSGVLAINTDLSGREMESVFA